MHHVWQLCFLFISLIETAFLTEAKTLFFVQDSHKRRNGSLCRQTGVPEYIYFPRLPATTVSKQMRLTYVCLYTIG